MLKNQKKYFYYALDVMIVNMNLDKNIEQKAKTLKRRQYSCQPVSDKNNKINSQKLDLLVKKEDIYHIVRNI